VTRSRALVVAVALSMVVFVGAVLLALARSPNEVARAGPDAPAPLATSVPVAVPAPAPATGTGGPITSADVGPGTQPLAEPSTEPDVIGPVDAAGSAAPEPYIQPFAQQPGVAPKAKLSPPVAALPMDVSVDGCDHHYGDSPQCVPWSFPPGVVDRCRWLVDHGFGPLAVHGEDRQNLDPDHDNVACGPGD